MKSVIGLILALAVATSNAIQLSGKVEGKFRSGTTKISLRGADGSYNITSFARSNGMFTLGDVPLGAYVVEAIAPGYIVNPERLEVRETRINCKYFDSHRGSHGMLIIPLKNTGDFFVPRPKFDIKNFTKNPMIIMAVVGMIFMVLAPKIMDNASPEDLKAMKGDQRVILHTGEIVEREELIPKWNPPTVKSIKTALDGDDDDEEEEEDGIDE